jgi:hypothetical protein
MILLGLQMLKLLPSIALPGMPKFLGHRIHDLAARNAAAALSCSARRTFFLPCGFTQALQLYVLAQASVLTGALTMLAFSLGTLPALLSLSAVSSFARGAFQRHFLKVAGAAVVVLGVMNIQYGLVLTGSELASLPGAGGKMTVADKVEVKGGKQIAVMRIVGLDYVPNRFTVEQGVPVEWRIDASEAEACGRILLAPRLGIRTVLSLEQHQHRQIHADGDRRFRVQLRNGNDDAGLGDSRSSPQRADSTALQKALIYPLTEVYLYYKFIIVPARLRNVPRRTEREREAVPASMASQAVPRETSGEGSPAH